MNVKLISETFYEILVERREREKDVHCHQLIT